MDILSELVETAKVNMLSEQQKLQCLQAQLDEINTKVQSVKYDYTQALHWAENRARRKIPMTMEDWSNRIDIYLRSDDLDVLENSGKITAEIEKMHAETEFEKYRIIQDALYLSDYDKYLLEIENEIK